MKSRENNCQRNQQLTVVNAASKPAIPHRLTAKYGVDQKKRQVFVQRLYCFLFLPVSAKWSLVGTTLVSRKHAVTMFVKETGATCRSECQSAFPSQLAMHPFSFPVCRYVSSSQSNLWWRKSATAHCLISWFVRGFRKRKATLFRNSTKQLGNLLNKPTSTTLLCGCTLSRLQWLGILCMA